MPKRSLEFSCAECPTLGKIFVLDSINLHYRNCHGGIAIFRCSVCSLPFDHKTSLIRHLKHDHDTEGSLEDGASGSNIVQDEVADQQPTSTSSNVEEQEENDVLTSISQDSDSDNAQHLVEVTEEVAAEVCNPYPVVDLTSVAANIIMELRSTARLTGVAIERFQKAYEKLFIAQTNIVKNKLFSSLKDRGIPASDIVNLLDEVHKIENPFSGLKTTDEQLDYFEEKYGLVRPEECLLDTRIDNRLDPKTNEYVPTQVTESFQSVSIIDTLKLVLSQKKNRDNIFQDYIRKKSGVLKSWMDGSDFENHPLLTKYPKALQICLFYDDLEIASALGSKTIIHKLGVFFFQILNGPAHLKSKLSSIHLLALAYADDLKKPGAFKKVLYKFVQDMKKLGSEDGVVIEIDGQQLIMRAVLVTVAADTLAAHQLLGFLSPAARFFCRVCMISRPLFRLDGNLEAELRTPENHDKQVVEVIKVPKLSTQYGVKEECCLNEVPYFHCVDGSVFDAFHDLLEGVVPAVLKMVLRNIIYIRKALTVPEFNMRIASFSYGIPDSKNKPSPNFTLNMLTGHDKPKQTGTQMWCLMRAFPFLVADCVAEGDPHMEVIFVTQDIMKIVFSFETTDYDLDHLDTLIFRLIDMFKSLYVDAPDPNEEEEEADQSNQGGEEENEADVDEEGLEADEDDVGPEADVDEVVPMAEAQPQEGQQQPQQRRRRRKKPLKVHLFNKLHHLKHYAEQQRKKGPIVRLWCAKFEACLKLFRQYASICCNFKNPPKTMAQMFQLSHLWSLLHDDESTSVEYKPESNLTPENSIHKELFVKAGISAFVDTKKVTIHGEEYRPGLFLVFAGEEPKFSLISDIYVAPENSVYFLVKPWKLVGLSGKYNAYQVTKDDLSDYALLSVSSVSNFRPLAPWSCGSGNIYIAPRTQVL
ncbi:uncharacterized protein LOC117645090 [Thrips palmi]|uniref:Uncharacterized protein LOC117645090 n=1 Tax=Thrips palmi TaxID=161013 RepID=A0A6P8ZMN2_THRPL|nr:uncharacterized protein LOC117645090 [Thrips palmi]